MYKTSHNKTHTLLSSPSLPIQSKNIGNQTAQNNITKLINNSIVSIGSILAKEHTKVAISFYL